MAKVKTERLIWVPVIASCCVLAGCATRSISRTADDVAPKRIRYLALGDSYTIGQSVETAQRWPVQLAALLRERGYVVQEPLIIAQTGWTTDELLAGMEKKRPGGTFELVSLLIGVNNQYRGMDAEEYRREFRVLLERAIGFAGGDSDRVVVLSIPDWGVTPFAGKLDRRQIALQIDRFNTLNREETERAGARYVDVTALSREALADSTLIASDGLHPSAKMYAGWARLALPEVLVALDGLDR